MLETWLCVVLGLIILGVVLFDILVSVFHPAAESALSAKFNRAVWLAISSFASLLPTDKKRRILSWTLPLTVAGLLIFWIALLLVGFALLYMPGVGDRHAFTSLEQLHWPDAFYLSGLCLTSIGFGDIVPHTTILRATTVAEGVCGLLVIGVAITYVLSVFPSIPTVNVLAITLNEESDGKSSAVPMVRRYVAVDNTEVLAQRCRELARELIVLTVAHNTHPVLFYARPVRPDRSFLRVLVVTQNLVGILRYGLRAEAFPTLVRDPRVVGLEESLIAVLGMLGSSLHLNIVMDEYSTSGTAPRFNAEFDEMIAALRQAGLRDGDDVSRRERAAYVRYRLVSDPYIKAYWDNTAYSAEEVWGDYTPLRGTTAPLPDSADETKSGSEYVAPG